MSIEPVGLLTVLVGAAALWLGARVLLCAFLFAVLLGAAAVLIVGPVSIPPGHMMLAFLAVGAVASNQGVKAAIGALRFPRAGYWLAALTLYGVASAYFLPRLLAGWTHIVPLGDSQYAPSTSAVPLGPISSNFTQSVYLIGDLVCFALVAAFAWTEDGLRKLTIAMLVYGVGNVVFAVLDIVTFNLGAQWLFAPIRNGQYTLHSEETIVGLKRIIGSFTEATVFARSSLGVMAFTGTLWMCGRHARWAAPLMLISLVLVVLSTSSAGLVALAPALLLLYVTLVFRAGINPRRPLALLVIMVAPLLGIAAILWVLINEPVLTVVRNYLDVLIFNKSTSQSGLERGTWNAVALQNFFDSRGLGVGLGTARASSFALALLANVGVPGTLFYLLFLARIVLPRRSEFATYAGDVKLAARNACLCLLMADALVATTVDQGLLFYILAAAASATTGVVGRAKSSPATLGAPGGGQLSAAGV